MRHECRLRVQFEPLAWYSAESDTGQGADFDAEISDIDILFAADFEVPDSWKPWTALTGAALTRAKAFLEKHHHKALWLAAERHTAEAFGVAA